jgi:nitrile hydratase accessory protein
MARTEPWQAQVLAMADTLSRSGAFTPTEWSAALGEELRRAGEVEAPDNAMTYYEAALAALERLLVLRGLATPDAIAERRDAWIRAYLTTPHGRPVLPEGE